MNGPHVLDRHDLDGRYQGRCDVCGEDIYEDRGCDCGLESDDDGMTLDDESYEWEDE